ncbi:MAG: nickel-binding protein [Pseudomonadota bacterium]
MKKYVIERDIPDAGSMNNNEAAAAAQNSNAALAQLAPTVQWQQSHVAGDKIFCVYLADDEDAIRKHSEISGIPITTIYQVDRVMDPSSAMAG